MRLRKTAGPSMSGRSGQRNLRRTLISLACDSELGKSRYDIGIHTRTPIFGVPLLAWADCNGTRCNSCARSDSKGTAVTGLHAIDTPFRVITGPFESQSSSLSSSPEPEPTDRPTEAPSPASSHDWAILRGTADGVAGGPRQHTPSDSHLAQAGVVYGVRVSWANPAPRQL